MISKEHYLAVYSSETNIFMYCDFKLENIPPFVKNGNKSFDRLEYIVRYIQCDPNGKVYCTECMRLEIGQHVLLIVMQT